MSEVVEDGRFLRYGAGKENNIKISQLQFANDTLIIEKKSWSYIFARKATWQLFELISNLNFNFHKSVMVRISVESGWLVNAVGVLTCKLRNMSFKYLVFLLGQFIGGCRLRNPLLLIL
jgi:hypothetical protein